MVWEPTFKELVESAALPLLSGTDPRSIGGVEELSMKVTMPVGMPLPPPLATTTAVKITVWPKLLGLIELVRVVLVRLLFTT